LAAKASAVDISRAPTAATTTSSFPRAGLMSVVGAKLDAPRIPIRTGARLAAMRGMLAPDATFLFVCVTMPVGAWPRVIRSPFAQARPRFGPSSVEELDFG
jgi:hypothetical protein